MPDLYHHFETMMDAVGRDLAENNENLSVAFSGGVDCTAVALSLCHAGAQPLLLHMRPDPCITRWNELFQQDFTFMLADYQGLSILYLPWMPHPVGKLNEGYSEFYKVFADLDVGTVVSGDGMDRCYYECYDVLGNHCACTFGEDIRVNHPLIELFGATIPRRMRLYQKSTYRQRKKSDCVEETLQKVSKNLVLFSSHPLYTDFFEKHYQEDVKDIVFPKHLTRKYVDKRLGRSYNGLLRDIYRLNRLKYESLPLRLLKHLTGNSSYAEQKKGGGDC